MNVPISNDDAAERDPIWVLIANVIPERPWKDPNTAQLEWRPGTKHFSGGTKVYCERPIGFWQWDSEFGVLQTFGRARKSNRWINVVTRVSSLENFRVKLEYNPHVLRLLLDEWRFSHVGPAEDDRQALETMAESGNTAAAEVAVRIRQLRNAT